MDRSKFIHNDGRINVKDIDKSVKNKFSWAWLEEKDCNGEFLKDYIKKYNEPGVAYCDSCRDKINYGRNG